MYIYIYTYVCVYIYIYMYKHIYIYHMFTIWRATDSRIDKRLQHTATHDCNILQHMTATYCNTRLQHTSKSPP